MYGNILTLFQGHSQTKKMLFDNYDPEIESKYLRISFCPSFFT